MNMIDVLGWWTTGAWAWMILVGLLYLAVFWMIFDILGRPDFSGAMKAAWIVVAILFSVVTLLVYVLWVRKKDYSR
jgi:Zn-dependent protease with chaperone function